MATISTQSPIPAPSAKLIGTASITCVTAILLALPPIITAAITPKFEQIFKDFGVALPWTSRVFINIGNALNTPLGWVMMACALAIIVVPASMLASRRWAVAITLLLAALFWFLGYILLLIISMFVPLTSMIESIQGGKP